MPKKKGQIIHFMLNIYIYIDIHVLIFFSQPRIMTSKILKMYLISESPSFSRPVFSREAGHAGGVGQGDLQLGA